MFYGNRGNLENIKFDNKEVVILDVINENEEILLKELSKKPKILEIYNKLNNALGELDLIENEHYYIEGFKFGFLMAKDIFDV
ncbi:MAG: hypothetical protein IJW26_00985 [Clostridia bacterium]|nr:hypothetical protein [Clostridia bacterium]